MDTPLYITAQAGFVLLTLVYIGLFAREIGKGVNATSWDTKRRKKFIGQMTTTILIWAGFVTTWSLSGKMSDFSLFPF
ncbi:MAG: hypothetical protein WD824_24960, partial [Cyclobacteriaceae bacterium]